MTLSATKTTSGAKARPFLKWAGGKSQLLRQFQQFYPRGLADGSIKRYIEPFLGGGAVFLDVVQKYSIADAVLFDVNKELILAYRVIQEKPRQLISLLDEHNQAYFKLSEEERQAYYYEVRDAYNAQRFRVDYDVFSDEWILRTARIILLNKTGFNGLYRVNSSGGYNVPFGQYERPAIFDAENILSVSNLLNNVILRVGSYEACRRFVNDTSFVYFDPPYRPISRTSNFTSYAKDKFDDEEQIRLANFFAQLAEETGAQLMLSNSDPHNTDPEDMFFEELYNGFTIHKVFAKRMISSNALGRGKISELLITTY